MTVIEWLLDSTPPSPGRWARSCPCAGCGRRAERARVATAGLGARLLALQGQEGQWAGGACFPAQSVTCGDEHQGQPWTATLPTLQLLRDFGVDPCADRVRWAVAQVRTTVAGSTPGSRSSAARSSRASMAGPSPWAPTLLKTWEGVVARLLGEQLEDGGWNCEAERGSVRTSFATTINVLQGLVAHERASGGTAEAIARGAGVKRTSSNESWSDGRAPATSSTQPGCSSRFQPAGTTTCCGPSTTSARSGRCQTRGLDEGIEVLRSKQQPNGTWLLENTHPGTVHFALEDGDRRPSRWNTLRALRVLRWWERAG